MSWTSKNWPFILNKYYGIRNRTRRYARRYTHKPKYFLSIYSIMQNESRILKEWIDIHLREGFEHFFLVDHASTDDWRSKLAPYIQKGLVTVKTLRSAKGDVTKIRADHADFALDRSEWIMQQDLDEFTYSTDNRSIAEFLRQLPSDIHQVAVPWVTFGTGGNLAHPDKVVSACLKCEDMALRPHLPDSERPWHVKSMFRSRFLERMNVHMHDVSGKTILPLDEIVEAHGRFFVENRHAARLGDFRILQNHYIHQSLEFYRRKMDRKGYWKENNRGMKSYTMERFDREEAFLNAASNTFLFEKHRDYYSI